MNSDPSGWWCCSACCRVRSTIGRRRSDSLIGIVYLDSRVAKGIFTNDDVDLLTAVTHPIAAALETARAAQLELAVQSARRQRDLAESLRQSMSELNATLEPHEVMRRMVERIRRSVPGGRTCVLYDHDGTWTLLTSAGARIDAPAIDIEALRVDAAGRQSQTAPTPQITELLGPGPSWLSVPLTTRGDRTGVVLCGSSADRLADAYLELVGAIVEQGATAYDNARLFSEVQRLATTDGLTGIANRRHFTELATRQIAVALRYTRPLAAAMLDIDHFKKINDAYGHGTGDEVIKTVATVLKDGVRESDIVGRLGGEEFALILPETDGEPVEITNRLRRAVAAATVTGPQAEVTVTISAGVAELKADDTLDSLLRRADAALYLAKADGRNQVRVG